VIRAGSFAAACVAASLTVACPATDDPAGRPAPEPPRVAAARPAFAPGETIHGLVVPAGSEHTASNDLGDDYIVPGRPEALTAYVASQLVDGTHATREPHIAEFRRVTPSSQNPAEVRLYILVMEYGTRGSLLRVQRLPAEALTPEQLRQNVERFRAEQGHLD